MGHRGTHRPPLVAAPTVTLTRILLLASVAWLAGFGWFEHQARLKHPAPAHADGILALTGGADRIETALRLLDADVAPVLLISGVGRVDLTELAARAHLDAGRLAPRVTLGHAATSTLGNAAEVIPWAIQHDIHTLAVVTAGYHMPRALLEIGRTLPGVTLLPVPVIPPALRQPPDLATLALLANEYDKLLAALIGWPR